MKLLYCARCTTPLMSAATVHICVSVKELMQSMEVTL